MLLRPTIHHTHFLVFLLRTISRITFSNQTSFSDSIFKTHAHGHHLYEVPGCTCNHILIIKLIQSLQENLSQLFLFQRWTDLCSEISLTLGLSFEGFIIILGHGLQFVSVWGQVQVVVVSLDESLAQIIEIFDISPV